ncbi:MAG: helix-turn-helix transcriptional regulator [Sphingobacteriaceae bacterium]|nr:helix-turn-helix transcriptional regulator [Sphingobacteriaceae bacterium]
MYLFIHSMIGKEIRQQRLLKGYSQCYMSYKLEISQNAYSKIELGQTDLTLRRLIQIAGILEVPITSLLSTVLKIYEENNALTRIKGLKSDTH